jgi:hypothetical protein
MSNLIPADNDYDENRTIVLNCLAILRVPVVNNNNIQQLEQQQRQMASPTRRLPSSLQPQSPPSTPIQTPPADIVVPTASVTELQDASSPSSSDTNTTALRKVSSSSTIQSSIATATATSRTMSVEDFQSSQHDVPTSSQIIHSNILVSPSAVTSPTSRNSSNTTATDTTANHPTAPTAIPTSTDYTVQLRPFTVTVLLSVPVTRVRECISNLVQAPHEDIHMYKITDPNIRYSDGRIRVLEQIGKGEIESSHTLMTPTLQRARAITADTTASRESTNTMTEAQGVIGKSEKAFLTPQDVLSTIPTQIVDTPLLKVAEVFGDAKHDGHRPKLLHLVVVVGHPKDKTGYYNYYELSKPAATRGKNIFTYHSKKKRILHHSAFFFSNHDHLVIILHSTAAHKYSPNKKRKILVLTLTLLFIALGIAAGVLLYLFRDQIFFRADSNTSSNSEATSTAISPPGPTTTTWTVDWPALESVTPIRPSPYTTSSSRTATTTVSFTPTAAF